MGNTARNAISSPAPTSKWYHDKLSKHVDEACEWMLKDDPLDTLDDQDLIEKISKGFADGEL